MPAATAGEHAIVIGGSMAGLCAARVLADHFARVTVVERDTYPADPVFRPGVPQARHVHVLLMRGQQIIEDLFPGFIAKLDALGAVRMDMLNDCAMYSSGGWRKKAASPLVAHTCSRPLLEWLTRQELQQIERVRFMQKHEVTGLRADPAGDRVVGVTVRARDGRPPDHAQATELSADLVVDASGRTSHAAAWLESLGYARPAETHINAFFGYASRVFQAPTNASFPWKGMVISNTPPGNLRGGVIWPIEGNQWMVVLGGGGRDYPPNDPDGFVEYTRHLPEPHLYEAIRLATPVSSIYGYRSMENRVRHYERLARQPDGFVVLGDAACTFNPIYGQGMSVGALGAVLLGATLRRQGERIPDLARIFQRALAKMNTLPWQLATSADLRVPGVEGATPDLATRLMHLYVDGVIRAGAQSARANRVFNEVAHLIAPPTALFQPDIIARALLTRKH